MINDWWLTILLDGAVHCWQLGDPHPDQRDELIQRARASVGFPAGNGWVSDGADLTRNAVTIAPGEPHESLLARATLHRLAELASIPAATVAGYRAQSAEAEKRQRISGARAALVALPQADRDTLLAELVLTPKPTATGPGR